MGMGEFFGEQALLYNTNRTATILSDGGVDCLTLSAISLKNVLGSTLQNILYTNSIKIALEHSSALHELTPEQVFKIITTIKIT